MVRAFHHSLARLAFSLALAGCLTFALVACGGAGGRPPLRGIVKVGLIAPFSGVDYALGYNVLFGAKLAVEEWNARGGPGGYRVEMVAQDEGGGAEAGRLQARKMTLDPDVVGIVGHLDGDSALAAAETYRQAGMAAIGLSPYAADGSFRLVAGEETVAEAVADLASRSFAARTAAVAASATPAYQGLADRIAARLAQQGVAVVARPVLAGATPEQRALAGGLRRAEPALIVLVGEGSEMGQLVTRLREAGVGSTVLVVPAGSPVLAQTAGRAAEDVRYLALAADPRDLAGTAGFVGRYRAVAERDPWGAAVLTYDALNLLLAATAKSAQSGPPTRARVAAELPRVGVVDGLSGPLSFDERGGRQQAPVFLYRLAGRDFPGTLVEVLTP